jgi:hypothetical protein
MRRAAALALALAALLAGCGDGGSDAPDLGSPAAEEAWTCLEEEGFDVVGGRSEPNDRDAPEVELTVRSGNVPIFVAYYESEEEAKRRERGLFEAVAPQQGTVLVRGSVAVVTGGLPEAEDKAAVEGCVF